VFTAIAFLLLTVQLVIPAFICGAIAIAAIVRWLWELDPGPRQPPVDIGGGVRLPVYVTGPSSHSWWAIVVLMFVSGALFACVIFSYLYLWTVSPKVWAARPAVPSALYPIASAALLLVSSGVVAYASRALKKNAIRTVSAALIAAIPLAVAACALDAYAQVQSGLSASGSSYGAIVYTVVALQAFYLAVIVFMAIYTIARAHARLINRERRATFDNTMLLWHYTVSQGLLGLALVHGFPRLAG
jgi:cytochrome c oxidase subunit I+III